MTATTEQADRISRRRAKVAPFMGLAVLTVQQWLFFSREWDDVNTIQLALWVILAVIVLLTVMTGGLWFTSRKIREIVNDDTTQRSRQRAIAGGFMAAMTVALAVFIVSPFEPISAQRAAHLIVSLGLGVPLLVFGLEESRILD